MVSRRINVNKYMPKKSSKDCLLHPSEPIKKKQKVEANGGTAEDLNSNIISPGESQSTRQRCGKKRKMSSAVKFCTTSGTPVDAAAFFRKKEKDVNDAESKTNSNPRRLRGKRRKSKYKNRKNQESETTEEMSTDNDCSTLEKEKNKNTEHKGKKKEDTKDENTILPNVMRDAILENMPSCTTTEPHIYKQGGPHMYKQGEPHMCKQGGFKKHTTGYKDNIDNRIGWQEDDVALQILEDLGEKGMEARGEGSVLPSDLHSYDRDEMLLADDDYNSLPVDQHIISKTRTSETRVNARPNVSQLISAPQHSIATKKGTLIVALALKQTIYLNGLVVLCPLVGEVTVHGYTLKEGVTKAVHSPISHALLGITASSASATSLSDHPSLKGRVSDQWLLDVITKETSPMVVLEIGSHRSPVSRFLLRLGYEHLVETKIENPSWARVGATLITKSNCAEYGLLKESQEWIEIVDQVKSTVQCGSVPSVVVCGGKGVGKSTFFRHIVNNLLSMKQNEGVLCLDLDIGQSELSMPSCVSLAKVTEPLTGPAYMCGSAMSYPYIRMVLIGAVSPQLNLQRYLTAAKDLITLRKDFPKYPLIVNTLGWASGTGLDIMIDILRLVQPTHVVQLQSHSWKSNYPFHLASDTVQTTKRGINTEPNSSELYYNLSLVKSVSGRKNPHVLKPKILRELMVLAHFSHLLDDLKDQEDISSKIVKVSWKKVALHVCNCEVPKKRILQIMNGSLIALCQVDCSDIETVSEDLPKQLLRGSSYGEVISWGLILGIDPLAQDLSVLTSLSSHDFQNSVNALIMPPEVLLPASFYQIFSSGEAPYLQLQTVAENEKSQYKIVRRRSSHWKPQKHSTDSLLEK